MPVAARWTVAVVASVLTFFLVAVPWAFAVPGGDDPWDVISPVAGVAAAGVLAGLGRWASQAASPTGEGNGAAAPAGTVHQTARTTGNGTIRQTGGNQGRVPGSTRHRTPPATSVRQDASGSGTIDQVGGDRA